MLECPKCQQKFHPGTRFCGSCGTPLAGTIPAVIPPDSDTRERLASSQNAPGFQGADSPDDTLLRKKPDGFSWQSRQTLLSDDERQQVMNSAFSEVEEVTVSIPRSALWSNDSAAPTAPVAPTPPIGPVTAVHVALDAGTVAPLVVIDGPVEPVSSLSPDLANVSSAGGGVTMPAQVPGEHMPFAIPARPGRGTANPATSVEPSEEMTIFVPRTRAQTVETVGNRTILDLPGDPGEALINYAAFTSIMQDAPVNSLASSAPVVPTGSMTRPLDETFISADLFAKIAALSPAAPVVSGLSRPAPEPEVENPEEPAPLTTTMEQTLSIIQSPPTSTIPETPLVPALIKVDEMTVSIVPVTPATPTEDQVSKVDQADEATVTISPGASPARAEEASIDPVARFAPFLKPADVPAHLLRSGDPYLHLKQELAAQRVEITSAMDELLPLVYDNHRSENETLFASILANRPALDDEAWGHAAFVLGAYGNYMYRNELSFVKKLEIWRAQLWAVYYERSYRRKYLAQRCQQLIHFFQGCAENPTFLIIALHDLETLYLYLEPGSLRKLQLTLQHLPDPPEDLLQHIEAQMIVAENEKAERMARQPAPAQPQKALPAQTGASKPTTPPGPVGASKPVVQLTQPGAGKAGHGGKSKSTVQPVREEAQEEASLALQPEARKWLSFLSEEQRLEFFASLRADRLETINQILLQARKPILTALRTELLNAGSLDYQRPRKSVPVRVEGRNEPDHDRFADAFRLLSSQKLKDQQAALRMFEQNARENIKQEQKQGAREWMLYARALTQGSTRVAPDWERDFRKDEASWEEIWNLAYYYRMTSDLAEAVRVLTPGLNELDAPVCHLRLALICSLTLLLEPGQAEPHALQNARDLLIHHLERWPHPLSCLAWLVLNYETPGTLRPLAQSMRLSLFQELLEYPVDLPDPRVELTEQQINMLEDALVSKTHCEEAWFLWLNDYAARRPHNFAAWLRLARTSERMDRLARAEVAFQHIAGIYYDLDYVYAQEGEEEEQAAAELRGHVEALFDFYRRHEMQRQAWDSFASCYSTLKHLGFWDEQKTANRRLLTLVSPFLMEYRHQEARHQEAQRLADAQDAKARSEIRRNEMSNNPTRPLEHFKSGRRVGIFVDYENIARFIPREEEMENVGQALAVYAAQFGEVVSRWASASPRNLTNLTAVRTGLEAAQFKVRYPRRELQFSASQKDLADYALLECITTASLNDRLDVYLVVSGDRDYYERIYSLLESGRIVRVLASECNLSTSYRELEQKRQQKHKAAGDEESDFFIDDLDEVLRSLSQ